MMKHTLAITIFIISTICCCSKSENLSKYKTASTVADVNVTVDTRKTMMTSSLELSTTLTHKTFKTDKYPAATKRAENMLREGVDCIGQFTMDWGAGNTNPSKDVYDFKNLDERVQLIHRLGKKVVLTLCRCPEWMRRDDANKGVDAAPRKDMYPEFAHMAADFIRHYDSKGIQIYAVNVWSETRGYWSYEMNRWELEDYAVLYNAVYDSIKTVNPAVLVGGPFMHVESSPRGKNMANFTGKLSDANREALKAFLDNARDFDFFSIDRNLKENGDTTPYSQDEILKYTSFNGVVDTEIKEMLTASGFSGKPLWVVDNQCLKGHFPENVEAAGLASMYRWHLLSGCSFVDKWQPEDEGKDSTDGEQIAPEGMYTHIDSADGAQPLPTYYVFKAFRECFSPGTQIVQSESDSEWVETLASGNWLMLINKHSTKHCVRVLVNGKENKVDLDGFEVKTIKI